MQPFGPEFRGAPCHPAWPCARAGDPAVPAIRAWVHVLREELQTVCCRLDSPG